MRRNKNTEKIQGYVYQHSLEEKTVKNENSPNYGKPFINGNLDVAVDEEGLNVITVHFSFVTEITKSGKRNSTYQNLKRIIDEDKTWIECGKEEALKVDINTALDLNDFYNQNDELVSAKRNEGGFVSIVNNLIDETERNRFNVDMLITSTKLTEADEEKNIKEPFLTLRGAIFNFRNDLLPTEFVVKNPSGIEYFENMGISNSNPLYTQLWGKIMSTTSTITLKGEETAFGGEAAVRTIERKTKEWIVTQAAKNPYDFGDEGVLTVDELTKAMQDREVHLADIKRRNEEYQNSKNSKTVPSFDNNATIPQGSFTF
jgi:hypothetical protein